MKTYITDIYIKGFQSHKDTHVKLTSGFNAIVGPSNSGKSAIIRNLEFVLFNELGDSNFITYGEETYSSTVVFSNGKKVTRERTKKENIYRLNEPGKEEIVLTNFGKGPVDEVINFHGIKPIKINGDDEFISIQSQHDKPFFLTGTPSEKASLIGAIAKTDAVDIAISDIALDVSRKKSEVKSTKAELKEKKEELKKFDDLPEEEYDLKEALKINEDVSSKNLVLGKISALEKSLEESGTTYRKNKRIAQNEDLVLKGELALATLSGKENNLAFCEKLAKSFKENLENMQKCRKITEKISEDEIKRAIKLYSFFENSEKDLKRLRTAICEINSLRADLEREKSLVENSKAISDAASKCDELKKTHDLIMKLASAGGEFKVSIGRRNKGIEYIASAEKKEARLKDELKEYIKQNPICPTCGQTIKEGMMIGS